jgi:hypothetical protein
MSEPVGPDLLLPPRARLFHVGPPKTASTALQNTAAAHRAELLDHGVRYPGRGKSQRAAVAAFIGRRIGYGGAAHEPGSIAPDLAAWDGLLAELDGDAERRSWFGHEYAAGADDATAVRFVEALGPRTHVVITLRDYGAMLPSIWQEYNKAGNTGVFDDWLRRVLATPRPDDLAATFHRRHDHGALVRRWAAAAGAQNVTVVVLDPADHGLVFAAFEAMLGLPAGLLAGGKGSYANRSMSVPELELLRRLNDVVRDAGVEWRDYQRLVVRGAARRMLSGRRPAAGEQRLALPAWAVEPVLAEASRHVEEIRGSGVRVVGDLDALARRPRVRGEDEPAHQDVATVPLEAAVEALAGLLAAAVPGTAPAGKVRPVSSLQVPAGIPGVNVHPTPELPAGAATWEGTRTLLVAEDVRSWLPIGTVAEMTAALDAWADAILAAGQDTVLAIHPGPVASGEELAALAAGLRSPYVDVTAEPPAPTPANPLVQRYDDVLTAQFTETNPPSRLTKAWGRADAVAAFARATDADPALGPEDAAAVRAATVATLARLEQHVTVVGPRELLLWPVPAPGKLPLELAVGVALDVLRAPAERRPRPFPGGEEIDRLEQELVRKQRELARRDEGEGR